MFKKGYIPWNKGKTGLTQLSTIGFKGKHHSKESKDKISKTHVGTKNGMFGKGFMRRGKGNPMYGKHMSDDTKKALRPYIVGVKNFNWKGGISKNKEYSNWSKNRWHHRKRMAEGSHTFGEWESLKIQYGFTCPCCGVKEPKIKLTLDHIIPLSKGGSDYIENIQPLCKSCNCKKHTKSIRY